MKWALGVAAVVLAGLGVYWWMARDRNGRSGSRSSTASHQREEGEEPAVHVKTVHPRRGGIARTTTQPGVIHYFEHADLFAKASGFLRAQIVDIGDTVTRGQVLGEVYDPERWQRVEEAAAQVTHATAVVSHSEALIKVAQADIQAATAELKERKAQVGQYVASRKYRQKQYVRYVELAVSRAIDERAADEKQEDFESARAGEQYAVAAVETAEGRLARAVAQLEEAKANLQVARARQRVAEAAEATARVLAEYTNLISPYDGVVTRRSFHRGAFVRSASEGGNDTPVLSIARTDLMRVVIAVPDRDVPYLDRGDQAVIRVDSLPGEVFKGQVARFSAVEDSANRTMRAEVDLPNPHGHLIEGMYGPATILLEPPADVLTIPSQALNEKNTQGQGSVFLVRDGTARKVQVQLGKDDGMRAEVLTGLRPDDTVVLSYTGSLDDGDPVDARPAAASQAKRQAEGD